MADTNNYFKAPKPFGEDLLKKPESLDKSEENFFKKPTAQDLKGKYSPRQDPDEIITGAVKPDRSVQKLVNRIHQQIELKNFHVSIGGERRDITPFIDLGKENEPAQMILAISGKRSESPCFTIEKDDLDKIQKLTDPELCTWLARRVLNSCFTEVPLNEVLFDPHNKGFAPIASFLDKGIRDVIRKDEQELYDFAKQVMQVPGGEKLLEEMAKGNFRPDDVVRKMKDIETMDVGIEMK